MPRLTVAQRAQVVDRYLAGESSIRIGESLNIDPRNVRGLLHRRGVTVRSQREAQTKYPLRHDAFDVLTADAMYWAGFLFADGHVYPRRRGSNAGIALVLAEPDRHHIEKFRGFLGSGHAITLIPRDTDPWAAGPAHRFAPRSQRIAERLLSLGIKGGPVDDALAISPHFWRGVVDGDGSIGLSTGRPRFELVGTQWLLDSFRLFVVAHGLSRARVLPHKSIYRIGLGAGPAVRCMHLLYGDAPTSLDRKRNAARTILAAAGFNGACVDGVRHDPPSGCRAA